jgi:hypothetical protein
LVVQPTPFLNLKLNLKHSILEMVDNKQDEEERGRGLTTTSKLGGANCLVSWAIFCNGQINPNPEAETATKDQYCLARRNIQISDLNNHNI